MGIMPEFTEMKMVTFKKLDEYYWESWFVNETRTHLFGRKGGRPKAIDKTPMSISKDELGNFIQATKYRWSRL